MNKFKQFSKRLMKNKSGQGMVEYILLLVVVVAIVVLMKDKLSTYVSGDMFNSLTEKIGGVMNN
ncbi:MAG: hypothetical protein KF789_14655 [Bdellovibrionaceae bacterium]|nr:hypothetical protein [Pseudobdellovibrionaceae bacterium]